jgi:hypothetical protein
MPETHVHSSIAKCQVSSLPVSIASAIEIATRNAGLILCEDCRQDRRVKCIRGQAAGRLAPRDAAALMRVARRTLLQRSVVSRFDRALAPRQRLTKAQPIWGRVCSLQGGSTVCSTGYCQRGSSSMDVEPSHTEVVRQGFRVGYSSK